MADKTSMEVKKCKECGVECMHNPTSGKGDRPSHRCTYCGYPAQGNGDSAKKAGQMGLMAKQKSRAQLLGIKSLLN